jgi:hypothetical protein
MSNSTQFIKTFENQEEVLDQIEKLKNQGHSEDNMYVMAREDDQLSLVRGRTDVDNQTSSGKLVDRFTSFLTGNDQVHQAFIRMGLDEKEADHYYQDVQDGKLLLYVNEEYSSRFETFDGDPFKLGEQEKTDIQNKKLEKEDPRRLGEDSEEEAVDLDERQYEDPESRQDKRNADPISKPDEKNFI